MEWNIQVSHHDLHGDSGPVGCPLVQFISNQEACEYFLEQDSGALDLSLSLIFL